MEKVERELRELIAECGDHIGSLVHTLDEECDYCERVNNKFSFLYTNFLERLMQKCNQQGVYEIEKMHGGKFGIKHSGGWFMGKTKDDLNKYTWEAYVDDHPNG